MAGPTQAHNDWVKDALNVDPQVYTAPDDDIEADLERLDPNKTPLTSVDLSPLRKDFSNPVYAVAKRARDAMIDLEVIGTVAWRPDDARGAAAVMAKSAAAMSREDRAILAGDLRVIDVNRRLIEHVLNDAQAATNAYEAAARQLRGMPTSIDAPAPPSPDPLGDAGAVLEHIWDFVNQVTQITDVLGAIHLVAGTDIIKDAIKQDKTDQQIDAINNQLDIQRDAINGLIEVVGQRARDDMKNSFEDYRKKLDELREGIAKTQEAIAAYAKDLAAFSRPAGAKGAAVSNPDAEKVMQTYKAVLEAAAASKVARSALNTKSLGPSAYKTWAGLMIPLGKPITDDAKTGGASLFRKGNGVTRYSETAAVTEGLASGLEIVVAVYDDAAKIDAWSTAWSAAMRAAP
jgi:hypothetical protein